MRWLSTLSLSANRVQLFAQPGGRGFACSRLLVGDAALGLLGTALCFADPLLSCLDLRFDLAETILGHSDRPLLGLALVLQLFLMGQPQLLAGLLGTGTLALQVGLQRLDLGDGAALGRAGDIRGGSQLALGLFDLGSEACACAGAAGFRRALEGSI
jgi:hypothetical protein